MSNQTVPIRPSIGFSAQCMIRRRRALSAVILAAAFGLATAATASQRAILLDGGFRDWRGIAPLAHDPSGDGAEGGIDLGRLRVTHDGRYLYLRLAVGRETLLQNGLSEAAGSNLRLFLDYDASAGTGLPVHGLGAELEARLGERQLFEYDATGARRELSPGGGKVTALPTHSASRFEIRVALPRAVRPHKKTGAGGEIRLLLVDEQQGGDRLPDSGWLTYRLDGAPLEPLEPLELERRQADSLRLLSLNVANTSIADHPATYKRLLQALAPDILSFQEVRDWSTEQTRAFVADVFPGRQWHAEAVADCVTVSPYPIVGLAAVDQNLVVHIDLPTAMGRRDLVLFNVHLPCCGNDADRDRESDNIAAAWRDMLAGRGLFPIDPEDAVVVLGDFNFVGFGRQLRAIRQGVFIDPSLGPSFAPGRARGSLAIASGRRTHANTVTTWRNRSSSFAPGRLDFIFFSSDALRQVASFSVDTAEMAPKFRRSHGLRHGDSIQISDHLPLIADFELRK